MTSIDNLNSPWLAADTLHSSRAASNTLGVLVRRHGADDTTSKAIKRIMRVDVIMIDDIGLLPVTTETAEAQYEGSGRSGRSGRSAGPSTRSRSKPSHSPVRSPSRK